MPSSKFMLSKAFPLLMVSSQLLLQPANAGVQPISDPQPPTPATELQPAAKVLRLSLSEALYYALQHHLNLQVERLDIDLAQTQVQEQEALFDFQFRGQGNIGAENAQRLLGASTEFLDVFSSTQNYQAGLDKSFPTGTRMALDLTTQFSSRNLANGTSNQQVSRLGLSFTQALLQGRDPAVNLARVRQAELGVQLARYNFAGTVLALVDDTAQAYWNLLLARQELQLTQLNRDLGAQELNNTQTRIQTGQLAGIEATLLEAELAQRDQELVNAKANIRRAELELLRLLNPDFSRWADYQIELSQPVVVPEVYLNPLEDHVKLALQQRPEILQAGVQLEQQSLEVIRTKDGLMPVLDVFVDLGKTGYSDSLLGSLANLPGSGFDLSGGFTFNYPLGARAAEAQYRRAQITQEQQGEALKNLRQLIELDVRRGYLNLTAAREQIDAVKATRNLQQTRYEAELTRYRVGRQSVFPVLMAQRDLLASQLEEARALVNYLRELTRFYRFEGTLLERYGLSLPKTEPSTEPSTDSSSN